MNSKTVYVACDGKSFDDEKTAEKYELSILGLTKKQQAAIMLHAKHCTDDHTDGCSWYYEIQNDDKGYPIHDWTRYAHKYWLDRVDIYYSDAVELINRLEYSDAVELINLLEGKE